MVQQSPARLIDAIRVPDLCQNGLLKSSVESAGSTDLACVLKNLFSVVKNFFWLAVPEGPPVRVFLNKKESGQARSRRLASVWHASCRKEGGRDGVGPARHRQVNDTR